MSIEVKIFSCKDFLTLLEAHRVDNSKMYRLYYKYHQQSSIYNLQNML